MSGNTLIFAVAVGLYVVAGACCIAGASYIAGHVLCTAIKEKRAGRLGFDDCLQLAASSIFCTAAIAFAVWAVGRAFLL